MNMQILAHIGLLYFVKKTKLFISIYCLYCIGCIDFMLAGKTLIDYNALFSPHDFDKKDQIILSDFKDT